MSSEFMNYLYFICIGIVGLIMMLSPRTFMGKAKFDEEAVKAESLLKKVGIALMVIGVLLFVYYFFFR